MKYGTTASGSYKRDIPAALRAVRALMRDANATEQVFIIMQSLNGPVLPVNLARLIGTEAGARQVYRRTELVERLSAQVDEAMQEAIEVAAGVSRLHTGTNFAGRQIFE